MHLTSGERDLDTGTVQEMIIKELGDEKIQVACIGPAGENGTLFAAIMNLRRSASRGGVGTVMGSKNIKAIAVRGTSEVAVADRQRLNDRYPGHGCSGQAASGIRRIQPSWFIRHNCADA